MLRFLVRTAQDLNSSLDLDEVFTKVAEQVRTIIDCHLFCVMLWNDKTQLLEHSFSLCHGEHVPLEGGFPLGTGISGTCAALRRPIRVHDVRRDPNYVRQRHPEVEIRAEMAVPLVFKDRLIGVIDLESIEPGAFTIQHEQMLTALASHIATALDNARLFERVRRDERRLERELDTAREIQKGLLPVADSGIEQLDVGAAYQPVRAIGGDFYDFLNVGDDRLAVVVGDVAGKGTPAALYASLAVGMMRGRRIESASGPASMMERLNEELRQPAIDNRFVAMSLAVFDAGTRRLDVANGGFPEPILLRDGEVRRIPVRGVPLGLLPAVRYDENGLTLRGGDVVAFCSDGLQDAINGEGEQFGGDGLADVLRVLQGANAQQIADGILRASTAYAGVDESRPDDRSAVVLKAI
jgi:sigma-B regulation protein RsbU (phosphoserine phosphatase)